jgi:hypothetical protein
MVAPAFICGLHTTKLLTLLPEMRHHSTVHADALFMKDARENVPVHALQLGTMQASWMETWKLHLPESQ